ncbi:spermidine resistance protein [Paramarasmius palmivorus]|uniref:adenosylmethionine decarboxylase n=1 Tax=Paramarasmius palmivorus TaxID=297713 RepID=A0AAW0C929_9AGAR
MSAAPFEGPEKLLEIWFAPSADAVPDAASPVHGRTGLRKIPSSVWDEMLSIVRCKVLSVITGTEIDAYLLSESSLFISPHRLILKTCGTTLNLLGLPRILEIAATQANMPTVYRCFYSRKSFMFPEMQLGPHRDWSQEVQFLDGIFKNGAAYTVGKVNGDHWLLYITGICSEPSYSAVVPPSVPAAPSGEFPDFTIEILMSDLSPQIREPFSSYDQSSNTTPSIHAHDLSASLGITEIFPAHLTTLDAYSFTPCGYSSNALIRWGEDPSFIPTGSANGISHPGEGYYTIHVTPESGWSYASFECNVPLPASYTSSDNTGMPDLKTLVRRVVSIFRPGRLSLTLFISSEDNEVDEDGEGAEEVAQRVFRAALSEPFEEEERGKEAGAETTGKMVKKSYRRTDKINYEFGGYDLAFASFELYDHPS